MWEMHVVIIIARWVVIIFTIALDEYLPLMDHIDVSFHVSLFYANFVMTTRIMATTV